MIPKINLNYCIHGVFIVKLVEEEEEILTTEEQITRIRAKKEHYSSLTNYDDGCPKCLVALERITKMREEGKQRNRSKSFMKW